MGNIYIAAQIPLTTKNYAQFNCIHPKLHQELKEKKSPPTHIRLKE